MTTPKVEPVTLYSPITGRKIRKSIRVVFPDGYVVRLLDPLPKGEAIRQATIIRQREEQHA